MDHHYEAMEEVDAAVFSGDLLENAEKRDKLQEYCARWLRAIRAREADEQDVPTFTIVNAGFNRKAERGTRLEHKNVTGIMVPMSSHLIGDRAFRAKVMEHAPAGEGWNLTGYCLAEVK